MTFRERFASYFRSKVYPASKTDNTIRMNEEVPWNHEQMAFWNDVQLRKDNQLDPLTNESWEQRLRYRLMMAEPTVKAAYIGKVGSVCSQELRVNPPRYAANNPYAKEIADFVQHNLTGPSGTSYEPIWEIGSGYFGCRDAQGHFSPEHFVENVRSPQVKMVEIKLSQGAKPGHGGVLPGPKVTEEIAEARGVMVGQDCVSPATHSSFNTPLEMMTFIQQLRTLSEGKPVGFKLCIGHPWEWFAIVKAMLETGIQPDFIVVDGAEGGTGAAPLEFSDHMGMPLQEALRLVHNTLVGAGLRDSIHVGASGKIVSAFDMARALALGADWCNSARGFMFALGCIQAQTCHSGNCPTGVTTQDPTRQMALVVPSKAERVHNFHSHTLEALQELMEASGLKTPHDFTPRHIMRRVSETQTLHLSELVDTLEAGALLKDDLSALPAVYRDWHLASATQFGFNPA